MTLPLAGHVALGTVALTFYWTSLLVRKGAPVHRVAGKICLFVLVAVGLSVGPVLLTRPGAFDPGYVVQMVYLTTCLATVALIAFTAIRYKAQPEQFRGRAFRLLGPVLLGLGVVVLAAGIATTDPVAITLSWVGLVFGPAMIAFARFRGELHPRWWLGWHLNAVSTLFNAVHGTFLYVAARGVGIVTNGPEVQTAFQLATIAAALAMRLWFGARFRAPFTFGSATPAARRSPYPSLAGD